MTLLIPLLICGGGMLACMLVNGLLSPSSQFQDGGRARVRPPLKPIRLEV